MVKLKHASYLLVLSGATLMFSFQKNEEITIGKYHFNSKLNASGAPAGRTGAPGEQNCTACHSSVIQNGDAINGLEFKDFAGNVVTSFFPDSTYTVLFTMNSASTKKGFQLVALDATANTQAGTLTKSVAGGTNRVTSGSKQYIQQVSSSTGFTSGWTFTWKAPTTSTQVRFYIASNASNANGSDSGDQIYLSQVNISKDATASLSKLENATDFNAFYNSNKQEIQVDFTASAISKGTFNLVDMQGKSVFYEELAKVENGKNSVQMSVPNLKKGIYFVHFFLDNNSVSKKIYVD